MKLYKNNRQSRSSLYQTIHNGLFDLIIIGSGITGATIFRDAVMKGLKTIMVETKDFTSGATGSYPKLFYGGSHYLQSMDIHSTEKFKADQNQTPHFNNRFIKSIPVMIPVYKKQNRITIKALLQFKDLLSGQKNHRFLKKEETLKHAPGLLAKGLTGSYIYDDALIHESRLTMEILKHGIHNGGIALNYSPVTGLLKNNGKINGILIKDSITENTYQVSGKVIINTSCHFTDIIRRYDNTHHKPNFNIYKETYYIFNAKDIPLKVSTTVCSPIDGKTLSFILYGDYILLGISDTDTDTVGNPVSINQDNKDVTYLLKNINYLFPRSHFGKEKIRAIYRDYSSHIITKERRQHHLSKNGKNYIEISQSGLVTVGSGSVTMARNIAKKIIRLTMKRIGHKICSPIQDITPALNNNVKLKDTLDHWISTYPFYTQFFISSYKYFGSHALKLWKQFKRSLITNGVCDPEEIIIKYICDHEMVCTVEDLMERRIENIRFSTMDKINYIQKYAHIIIKSLGISTIELTKQLQIYNESDNQENDMVNHTFDSEKKSTIYKNQAHLFEA